MLDNCSANLDACLASRDGLSVLVIFLSLMIIGVCYSVSYHCKMLYVCMKVRKLL